MSNSIEVNTGLARDEGRWKVNLYLLSGIAFAGKTTFAKKLVTSLGFVHVSTDEISIEKGFYPNDESIPVAHWRETYAEAYRRIDQALCEGKRVMFDHANHTRAGRDEVRAFATKYGLKTVVIFFDVNRTTAKNRWLQNLKTQKRFDVRQEDFLEVVNMFERPTEDENVLIYDGEASIEEWLGKNKLC